ncbi:hypothetical protein PVK06_004388 [Gossypium arboreum]|uniref:Uncharacterized protein n=1 Tax=Gossypium arboreum TaxID=29729 RepID=A0ABR0QS51_GOSAR|nr:hypothetical protein PVK06_004388 [Gossypium arboreum]
MDWFKHYGKLCLLPTLEKSKQYRRKRPRREPINLRSAGHVTYKLTSAPHAHANPVPVQPPDHVANTPNNIILSSWVVLANADLVREGCTMASGTWSQSSTEGRDEVIDQPQRAHEEEAEVLMELPTQTM